MVLSPIRAITETLLCLPCAAKKKGPHSSLLTDSNRSQSNTAGNHGAQPSMHWPSNHVQPSRGGCARRWRAMATLTTLSLFPAARRYGNLTASDGQLASMPPLPHGAGLLCSHDQARLAACVQQRVENLCPSQLSHRPLLALERRYSQLYRRLAHPAAAGLPALHPRPIPSRRALSPPLAASAPPRPGRSTYTRHERAGLDTARGGGEV